MTHTHTLSSSGRVQDRTTPRAFFLQLDAEFHFTLDAAADETNHLCQRYFSIQEDALARDWPGVVWCNPPFSQCNAFVRKGAREAEKGSTVVFLVPARTDTSWWHDVVLRHAEVRYIRGRLKYGGGSADPSVKLTSAPFASVVLVFRPKAAT